MNLSRAIRLKKSVLVILLFLSTSISNISFAQDSLKTNYLNSQNESEKLKNGINYLSELKYNNPQLTIATADTLVKLCFNKDEKHLIDLYSILGASYWHLGELTKSTNYFTLCYNISTKHKASKEALSSLNSIGYNYFELGDYSNALRYLYKALKLGKQLNDEASIAITETYIGQINGKLKKYPTAIKYYNESLIYFKIAGKFKNEAIIYNNIGNCYLEENKYDSAIYWFNLSLELSKEKNYTKGIALASSNAGLAYLDKKEYSNAEEKLILAYTKYDSLQNDLSLVMVCTNLIRLYTETNQLNKALQYAKKGEELAFEIGSFEQQVNLYASLSNMYIAKHEPEKALNYLKLQLQFSDSLANENSQRIQNEMTTRFETENLNDKITLLTNTNKLKDAEIEKKKTQQYLYLVLVLGSIILIGLLFFVLRTKNKSQKQLLQKNKIIENALDERGILLKEIHHRVKNNLQIISSLLSLQSGYGNSISTEDLVKQSESRIRSMALIHEKLYQTENFKEIDLNEYLQSFLEQLSEILFFKEKNIEYQIKVESIHIEIDKLVPLGLIVNELITNTVKHAFKNKTSGIITITGKHYDRNYTLSINDNGEGMPSDFSLDKSKSLGIRLIKGLVNQIQGKLVVQSKPGNTTFNIEI